MQEEVQRFIVNHEYVWGAIAIIAWLIETGMQIGKPIRWWYVALTSIASIAAFCMVLYFIVT